MRKIYAKVYEQDGTFLSNVFDINRIGNISKSENQINMGVQIGIAQDILSLDERGIVEFNKEWRIYVEEDRDAEQVFRGYVSAYDMNYNTNEVNITLNGFDSDLDAILFKSVDAIFDSETDQVPSTMLLSKSTAQYRLFEINTTAGTTILQSISIYGWAQGASDGKGGVLDNSVNMKIYESEADAKAFNGNYIGSVTKSFAVGNVDYVAFSFNDLAVNASSTYYVLLENTNDDTVYLPEDDGRNSQFYDGSWSNTTGCPMFKAYTEINQTSVQYTSEPIENIVTDILESFAIQGGNITGVTNQGIYTDSSQLGASDMPMSDSTVTHLYMPITTGTNTFKLTGVTLEFRDLVSQTVTVKVSIYEDTTTAEAFGTPLDSFQTSFVCSNAFGEVEFPIEVQVEPNTTYYLMVEAVNTPSGSIFVAGNTSGANAEFYDSTVPSWASSTSFSSPPFQTYDLAYTITAEDLRGETIQATNKSVSYTFNTATCLEALEKCRELAGSDWYWYVDTATNTLYFKQQDDATINHRLKIGKEISNLSILKRQDNIVSDIYFSGGDTGGGAYLYNRYTNSGTANSYRYRATRYYDGRVTTNATAESIANTLLGKGSVPEVIATIEVVDNNGSEQGYDIDTFSVGQYIQITNTDTSGSVLWDRAQFDVDYWDYNLAKLHTVPLRIVTIKYKIDSVTLEVGALPDNLFATIEQTRRGVKQLETLDNSTTPS